MKCNEIQLYPLLIRFSNIVKRKIYDTLFERKRWKRLSHNG